LRLAFLNKFLPQSKKAITRIRNISQPAIEEAAMDRKILSGVLLIVLGITSSVFAQQESQDASDSANVAGTWHVSWQGRRGSRKGVLEIQQNGSKLTGKFQAQGHSAPLTGSVQGNNVSFSAEGERMKLEFTGTIERDKMTGTTRRGASWSATRQERD
jgi:hypothetical protein